MRKFFTLSDPVVPMHNPRLLVETAAALGADREALLENVGITAAMLDLPTRGSPTRSSASSSENALEADQRSGARAALRPRNTRFSHRRFGIRGDSDADLAAGFRLLSQYMALLDPGLGAGTAGGRRTRFHDLPSHAGTRRSVGFCLGSHGFRTVRNGGGGTGRKVPVNKIMFNHPRPAHYRVYSELIATYRFTSISRPPSAALLSALRLPRPLLGPHLEEARDDVTAALRNVVTGMVAGLQHLDERRSAAYALLVIGAHRFCYGLTTVATILLYRNYFHYLDDTDAALAGLSITILVSGAGYFVAAVVTPVATTRLIPPRWILLLLLAAAVVNIFPAGLYVEPAIVVAAFFLGIASQGIKICVDQSVQTGWTTSTGAGSSPCTTSCSTLSSWPPRWSAPSSSLSTASRIPCWSPSPRATP